jgi:ArsR family transcriptional regulator, virulence genes transcriptional regulator
MQPPGLIVAPASMKTKADVMQTAADDASSLLRALASRHRLLILCQLVERERSVGDLAEFLSIRDSTASRRRDGIVAARRDGQTIWYSIRSAPAQALVETLYRVYCAHRPRRAKP